VRAKIRPERDCIGVQLQFGFACQGMLTQAGTFVWKEGIAASDRSEQITGRREIDLVVERRGKDVTVWIDGFKIVQGVVGEEPGTVGIGVARGTALFEKVRIRELK
jgi:hypothetical protein